jgi:prepilin-type N-terminal cleavage/methylation domain-containing protein/prepilin-type processing-associated H-X9-DG protein
MSKSCILNKTGVPRPGDRGFTLIELLVAVSIIALLISILLPSLRSAREQAKAVVCATNTRHVGQSIASYLVWSKGIYPASYVYPHNDLGEWDPDDQPADHPYGYLHWSWFLYEDGKANDKAFHCPKFNNGGTPRTNPGPDMKDREPNQRDQNGDRNPSDLTDKQAPRMAYAGNAALIPRNKFTTEISGGSRVNQFVPDTRVKRASETILATEFINKWELLGIKDADGTLSKSHRPINVFWHVGSGYNEYLSDERVPGFMYGLLSDQETYGVRPIKEVLAREDLLDYTSGYPQVNAVGRHHPGGNDDLGGTANFLFCDGHSERMHVLKTMERRLWGDRYYSLSGRNEIINMTPVQ